MSKHATVRHVADADDCREPFDWSEHTTGTNVDCWCQPTVQEEAVSESDDDYRERLIDSYGMWGALVTEMVESSGSTLDVIGRSLHHPVIRRTEQGMIVCHRRPIEYDIVTGEPRVEGRL